MWEHHLHFHHEAAMSTWQIQLICYHSWKMSCPMEVASKFEIHAVIQFLWTQKLNPTEFNGNQVKCTVTNHFCCGQLQNGVFLLKEGHMVIENYCQVGRPSILTLNDNVDDINKLIHANRWIRVDKTADELNISYGSVHHITTKSLEFWKVYAQWVHHFSIEMMQMSCKWKHSHSLPTKQRQIISPTRKVMLILFFDNQGVVYYEFMMKGTMINAASYCATFKSPWKIIKYRQPGKLSRNIVLLHDSATPHSAYITKAFLDEFKWEVWEHPPYIPDLLSCDFHVLDTIKNDLAKWWYHSDEDVKHATWEQLS